MSATLLEALTGPAAPDPLGLEVKVRSVRPAAFDVYLDGVLIGVVAGGREQGWTARPESGHLNDPPLPWDQRRYSSRQTAARALLPGPSRGRAQHHPHIHRESVQCWLWDCPCGAGARSRFTALPSQHAAVVAGLAHLDTEPGE